MMRAGQGAFSHVSAAGLEAKSNDFHCPPGAIKRRAGTGQERDRQTERRSNNTIAGSTPAAAGMSGRHATPARPAANGSCAPAAAVKSH